MAKTKTIKGKGNEKPIHFHPGGLHESLGISSGKKIPAASFSAALSGSKGPKAQKQAQFAKNVLKHK